MCDDDPADFRFWGWATSHTDAVAAAVAATLPLPWATAVAGTALRRAQPGPRPRVPWLDALAVAVQAVLVALQPPLGLRLAVFAAHTVAVCSAQTLAPWAPLAAPAAALVAAFLTERPCTAPWLAAVDAVAGLYAAWRWSRGRRRRLVALGCYAEAAAVLVFFFYEGQLRSKESHLVVEKKKRRETHRPGGVGGDPRRRCLLGHHRVPPGAEPAARRHAAGHCVRHDGAVGVQVPAAPRRLRRQRRRRLRRGQLCHALLPDCPPRRVGPAAAVHAGVGGQASVGAFIVAVYATSVDAATVYGCSPALSPAAASVLTVVLGLLGVLTSAVATYAADTFFGYNKL